MNFVLHEDINFLLKWRKSLVHGISHSTRMNSCRGILERGWRNWGNPWIFQFRLLKSGKSSVCTARMACYYQRHNEVSGDQQLPAFRRMSLLPSSGSNHVRLRIGARGRFLSTQEWPSNFYACRRISWLCARREQPTTKYLTQIYVKLFRLIYMKIEVQETNNKA